MKGQIIILYIILLGVGLVVQGLSTVTDSLRDTGQWLPALDRVARDLATGNIKYGSGTSQNHMEVQYVLFIYNR